LNYLMEKESYAPNRMLFIICIQLKLPAKDFIIRRNRQNGCSEPLQVFIRITLT